MALDAMKSFLLAAAGEKMLFAGPGWSGDRSSVDPIGSIDGFAVDGYGEKLRLPKGRNGNDNDIVITTKAWYAPSIKMVMLMELADSRFGTTRIGLTDIEREEPEPVLFTVPSGYHTIEAQETFSLRWTG